jgi:hypothetical protein
VSENTLDAKSLPSLFQGLSGIHPISNFSMQYSAVTLGKTVLWQVTTPPCECSPVTATIPNALRGTPPLLLFFLSLQFLPGLR